MKVDDEAQWELNSFCDDRAPLIEKFESTVTEDSPVMPRSIRLSDLEENKVELRRSSRAIKKPGVYTTA